MITIRVNDRSVEVLEDNTLEQILLQLVDELKGVAVALNSEIVHRRHWSQYTLQTNDRIDLFNAVAGG